MARDYNIYIHFDSVKGTKTAPQGESAKQSSESPSSVNITPSKVVRAIKSPVSSLIGSASKVVPEIAAAVAIASVIDSAVSIGTTFISGYSGNNEIKMNYANFKTAVGAFMNPLGTLQRVATANMEAYKYNTKQEELRELTGNSIINNYNGKAS